MFSALLILFFSGCHTRVEKETNVFFESLDSTVTAIGFSNNLEPSPQINMFEYMYFYNGAGVGLGDFNKDGKIDIFFASNLSQNRLYLNDGEMHFRDITAKAGIPNDGGWSTGVSVIDINQDGWLDFYVCRVGNLPHLKSHNLLLVCQGLDSEGNPFYKDESASYGLDFSGFSTQAAFLDYDLDGDLDLYLMNHSLRFKGSFNARSTYAGTMDSVSGDRLYENRGDHFEDVTGRSGINSSIIGYGLGVVTTDINMDGYPDLYIANDFQENDYLYINQKNGTFRDVLEESMMHTSQFSMGVDAGDINNDARSELVTLDMLPEDPYILKRSLGEDENTIYNLKRRLGFFPQYARNNLQFNRGNGSFSEIAQFSGIAASDWSWAPLWLDFNNDGLKDLFISNGIPKRLNDIDYINFVSNEDIQQKIRTGTLGKNDFSILEKIPEIKLANKFYLNRGDFRFDDLGEQNAIRGNQPTYSNGSAYADLDNDGDLDLVVNNINEPALIYRNLANEKEGNVYLDINLSGPRPNLQAIGSKLFVYSGSSVQYFEKTPTHGFQSSMEVPIHVGLSGVRVDSILLVWPNGHFQHLPLVKDTVLNVAYQEGLPVFDYSSFSDPNWTASSKLKNITDQVRLYYRHHENNFNEFDREPLIPHMISREGPALAIGDANKDHTDDVFIGASKREKPALFFQDARGVFHPSKQPALDADSIFEDIDAGWMDLDGDGDQDLVVVSGGNEFEPRSEFMSPRVYLNDGLGNLTKKKNAFDSLFVNASCLLFLDLNKDGKMDLFIGGRSVPYHYGEIPRSYFLENNGDGSFRDVTSIYSDQISSAGFVTGAALADLDGDGTMELVLSQEWGGIDCYVFNGKKYERQNLFSPSGWWNFVYPCDIDGDGDMDLVLGNMGLNNRFRATEKEPVRMYINDFDDNGKTDPVLTFYLQGQEIPFATKMELEKQMPALKKKFLYANDYARATLENIFSSEKLDDSKVFSASYFTNIVLINDGRFQFHPQPFPWQAQLSCYRDVAAVDANHDSLPDLLLVGNNYGNTVRLGREDADFGTLLINQGKGNFYAENLPDLKVKGESRHIRPARIGGKESWILARNDDSTVVIQFTNSSIVQK